MKSCVFCSSEEIKEREIVSNDLARAFLTNTPIVPGHVLVVPKRCTEKFEDLTGDEKLSIEDLRVKAVGALKKSFGAEGFNFAWNDAVVAGQSVPHFHLHVVPRKKDDAGVIDYEPRKFLYRPGSREKSPEAELKKVAELIKKFI